MPNGATGSTSWSRSQRGTGVSPVKDPFGVQALACPDQCSLKAELRTCTRRIFVRLGVRRTCETVSKIPNGATRSTWWPRSQRGTGVSPVKDLFGVQALACPDQCSLKAELRTCTRRIFVRLGARRRMGDCLENTERGN